MLKLTEVEKHTILGIQMAMMRNNYRILLESFENCFKMFTFGDNIKVDKGL
jgi:hypothetical protein